MNSPFFWITPLSIMSLFEPVPQRRDHDAGRDAVHGDLVLGHFAGGGPASAKSTAALLAQ